MTLARNVLRDPNLSRLIIEQGLTVASLLASLGDGAIRAAADISVNYLSKHMPFNPSLRALRSDGVSVAFFRAGMYNGTEAIPFDKLILGRRSDDGKRYIESHYRRTPDRRGWIHSGGTTRMPGKLPQTAPVPRYNMRWEPRLLNGNIRNDNIDFSDVKKYFTGSHHLSTVVTRLNEVTMLNRPTYAIDLDNAHIVFEGSVLYGLPQVLVKSPESKLIVYMRWGDLHIDLVSNILSDKAIVFNVRFVGVGPSVRYASADKQLDLGLIATLIDVCKETVIPPTQHTQEAARKLLKAATPE